MGKAIGSLLALSLLLSVAMVPARSLPARAQTAAPALSCSGAPEPSPMQGHYTGTWHSDGVYHFTTLGHDIQLTITIDGTLDATVAPDGTMTGTVQGKVDAPVTHEGQKDVSSGTGTISGTIQGVFAASGSVVLLPHPTILMHWGTFVGGGYTADRTIVMPDYQLPVAGFDCVSAQGSITETGFPVQTIVDDFNGGITQVPGIGTATGTWSLSSDSAATFQGLSQQVDAFIGQANALLGDPGTALTPALIQQQIVAPLQRLEAAIEADPTVARCLLDRLGAWESLAVRALQGRAGSIALGDLLSLRHAGDAIRAAQSLNLDCHIALDATAATITAAGNAMLDAAINARAWPRVALLARELILLGGDSARASLQARIGADLHAQLGSGSLALARAAYVFADDADAIAAANVSAAGAIFHANAKKTTKKRKKHHAPPKATPRPTATTRPTATPTPTQRPKTLTEILSGGIAPISAAVTGGTAITWTAVPGATTYVVTASSGGTLAWSWAGTATSVTYGDTSIDGAAGTAGDAWPVPAPGALTWSVLALDGNGKIIGAAFRVG